MKNKVKYGQFYTKNAEYIIGNLIEDLDKNKVIVEPFCGEGDLLLFNNKVELYDIDPKLENCVQRDTLKDVPDYKDKLVVTNPPFLAKNKNTDKSIYDLYNVGDLYKAAIKSILKCDGGIIIIPLNFFCDEDNNIRNIFFENFNILKLNIFEETVFDDTSYTICSFLFEKKTDNIITETKIVFFPSKEEKIITFSKSSSYKIGSDFIEIIETQENIGIGRLQLGGNPNSNLYLRAIDTGSEDGRINLSINKKPFFGKISDRTFATITMDKKYTEAEEKFICLKFNQILEENRKKYNSLFLTAYRNSSSSYSRKRISFDVAYKLISYIVKTFL